MPVTKVLDAAVQVHKTEQSGEMPMRKVVGVVDPHANKPAPVVDKLTSPAKFVAPPQLVLPLLLLAKLLIAPVCGAPPKTSLVPTAYAEPLGWVTQLLVVPNGLTVSRRIAVPPAVKVHGEAQEVELVLILKESRAGEHTNTPVPIVDKVLKDAQSVAAPQLEKTAAGPTCVAVENRSRVPAASVPTAARKVSVCVAPSDADKTAVAVVLANIEIDNGSWDVEPAATLGAQ